MLEAIKALLFKLNESHFGIIVTVIAMLLGYTGTVTQDGTIQVLGNSVCNLATFLLGATGLTALYGTLNLNVRKEILDEKNIALAIVMMGLYIGLGMALGG